MSDLDDFALNTEMRTHLREPFDTRLLSKVNKGFGAIDTINHAVVTDRLNKVAPGWTMGEPQFVELDGVDGMKHCLAVVNWMQIGTVRRWEIGEVEHPSTYGDEAKKAMSDWIKRAAMRFGVAIDLWTKEDLSVGESTVAPNAGQGTVTSARAGKDGAASDATRGSERPSMPDASPTLSVVAGEQATDVSGPEAGTTGGEATDTSPSGSDSTYLTKDEQKELIQDYGSSKLVVAAFQEHFGERIQRVSDITCEMVEAMNE